MLFLPGDEIFVCHAHGDEYYGAGHLGGKDAIYFLDEPLEVSILLFPQIKWTRLALLLKVVVLALALVWLVLGIWIVKISVTTTIPICILRVGIVFVFLVRISKSRFHLKNNYQNFCLFTGN